MLSTVLGSEVEAWVWCRFLETCCVTLDTVSCWGGWCRTRGKELDAEWSGMTVVRDDEIDSLTEYPMSWWWAVWAWRLEMMLLM